MNDSWPSSFAVTDSSLPSIQNDPNCVNQSLTPEKKGLVSNEALDTFLLVHLLLLIPMFFLIATPLCVLSMLVFRREGLKDRLTMCLFSLAVVNLLYMTWLFAVSIARGYWRLKDGLVGLDRAIRFLVNSKLRGLYGLNAGPCFLAAIISTEKCVCVLFPLKAKKHVSSRTLAVFIVTGLVLFLSLRFVVLARMTIGCEYVPKTGEKIWVFVKSQFYWKNKKMINNLDSVLYGGVVTIGSIVIVITTTVITALRLQQYVHWRRTTSIRISRKELRIARMIIWLSVAFTIHAIPALVMRFSEYIDPEFHFGGRFGNLYSIVAYMNEWASSAYAIVGFFVYYVCSTKFRVTLSRVTVFGIPMERAMPFINALGTIGTTESGDVDGIKSSTLASKCKIKFVGEDSSFSMRVVSQIFSWRESADLNVQKKTSAIASEQKKETGVDKASFAPQPHKPGFPMPIVPKSVPIQDRTVPPPGGVPPGTSSPLILGPEEPATIPPGILTPIVPKSVPVKDRTVPPPGGVPPGTSSPLILGPKEPTTLPPGADLLVTEGGEVVSKQSPDESTRV